MDPREAMTLPGTASYYMPRGMTGSVASVQGMTSMHPLLTGAGVPFQLSSGNSSVGQTLVVDPSSTMSPRGGVGAPSALPQSEPPVYRKRGRPRKYGVDSSKVSLALTPPSAPAARLTPSQKRGRGRPPGTGRKQQLASLGGWMSHSAGSCFTPHITTVAVGEDITTKIMSFLQQGPKAVCILSANGAVTTVTLRQPSTSGGIVTYEGQFEILSLSGSYLLSNSSGPQGLRTGSLSICVASPDGRVIGGGVGGVLIAASPVQVILGSFICVGSKAAKSKPPNQNLNWPLQ